MVATTVIISPRDRYSGLAACVETLYRHTPRPFALWVLDLGYPESELAPVRRLIGSDPHARIVRLGLMTPMDALRAVRQDVSTPTVVLLDNDSRVTPGWLPPLLAAHEQGASVVSPLILERDGLDAGAPLRNHLYTGELRVVDVDGRPLLIEQKHYRRAEPSQIPHGRRRTGTFELHCVLFDAETFRSIELPSMVIREHLDIALQVQARGGFLEVEPVSVVTFDNLSTRMRLADMRYFFHRWSSGRARRSSRLFERRWGYNFYSEQAAYTWIFRRKTFLLARWLGLPIGAANRITAVARRLFCRDFDPLPDPEAASRPLLESGIPEQRDRAIA